jgi:TRAP-type uncharacterized transport system substrate-binding protein
MRPPHLRKKKVRNFIIGVVLSVLAIIASLWAAIVILKPGPKGEIILGTGGAYGAYHELAESYKKELATYGINLVLRPDAEGSNTQKGLLPQFKSDFKTYDDKYADIQAGFLKGGFSSSLQGRLATARQNMWRQRQAEGLRSIGRLFYEPIWIFVRASDPAPITSLRDLKGKKVSVGTTTGGSRRVVLQMLKANDVDSENSKIKDLDFPDHGEPLLSGEVDAAFLVGPPETERILKLLNNPALKLFDLGAEADGYTTRFPFLDKLVLRRGAIDFNPITPATDVTLLATSASLLVRADLNASLVSLLTNAVIHNPKSGFDKAGDPVLFYKPGQFPHGNDPEFELHPGARVLYKTGELPVALRTLAPLAAKYNLPFWPAAFINEHGMQTILLLIPLLSILVPAFKFLPWLYNWMQRRRLLYWYGQLKQLEGSITSRDNEAQIAERLAELDVIDAAVSRIKVPLHFSEPFYDLLAHIELVRNRLRPKSRPALKAAE